MIKIIWSYWNGPTDNLMDACLQSWITHMKGWEIRILDDETLKQYNIKTNIDFEELPVTTKSDIIRLNVLYRYGGLWMDRTILLNEPGDWINKYSEQPYFGFRLTSKKYFENWFILVPMPYNEHIRKWRDLLLEILETKKLTDHKAFTSVCVTDPVYFVIYQAFCYLVDSDLVFRKAFHKIPIIVGNDFFYTPLRPIHDQNFIYN